MSNDAGERMTLLQMLASMLESQDAGDRDTVEELRNISPDILRRILISPRRAAADSDDEDDYAFLQPRPSPGGIWEPEVTVLPQPAGVALMHSGEFGRIGHKNDLLKGKKNVARAILDQPYRIRPTIHREDYTANLVPNTHGTVVAEYDSNIYTGQYSADASFYYTCSQDFKLHVYDMTVPPVQPAGPPQFRSTSSRAAYSTIRTSMKLKKQIQGCQGRWTITDANLSPDSSRLIYSSISSTVYMTNVLDSSERQIPISFSDPRPTRSRYGYGYGYDEDYGIWTCRFSADGNEIVAGGSGKILVYDLLANRRTVKIAAHENDVNSCCWADTASGNVLISASDDTFIKIWDRRSLGSSQKPSGVLIGHTEGLTYVSAKGDGRYIISNGKDQALRLWDLRKMRSNAEFEEVADKFYGIPSFDYRGRGKYPKPRYPAHPLDCSVMTYRGHSVMRTLIRCHFSPAETTGGQYIYSGSSDGRIHIWSLDGRIVQVLDRGKSSPLGVDPSGPEDDESQSSEGMCVRDVSWNPQEPVLMSAAWDDVRDGSTVARHEWKGLTKMLGRGALEDWTERYLAERSEKERRRASGPTPAESGGRRVRAAAARYHLPGAYEAELEAQDDEDDEEDVDWVSEQDGTDEDDELD